MTSDTSTQSDRAETETQFPQEKTYKRRTKMKRTCRVFSYILEAMCAISTVITMAGDAASKETTSPRVDNTTCAN